MSWTKLLAYITGSVDQENRSWGYHRIVGTLASLGYTISD